MPRTRTLRSRKLGAALLLLPLWGCAYSMIRDGALRPEPVRAVLAHTVRARGIEPSTPIEIRVVRQSELQPILASAVTERHSRAELHEYQRALVAIGLWPADRDLFDEALAVYGEEVVGLYLPSRGELVVVENARAPVGVRFASALFRRDFLMELTLSHEIVHLLQHQAYPELIDPQQIPTNDDDLESAIQAAIEGDAMLFGFEAVGAQLPEPDELRANLEEKLERNPSVALAEAPALIRLTLSFPYARGYALAWSEGHRLLERPPLSTEQAMHQERRFEPFLQLDLGSLERGLAPSCQTLQRNTIGELGISVLFRDLADDPRPAIWEGWNGDRYLVAECQGRLEWVWWSAWDSEEDAIEFAESYRRLAPAVARRAGFARHPTVTRRSTHVVATSAGFAEWAAADPPPATKVTDLESLLGLLRESPTEPVAPSVPEEDPG